MYATPVIYPMSSIPEKYRPLIEINPMSAVIETFRAIYLGPSPSFGVGDFKNFPALAGELNHPPDAVSAWLQTSLTPATRQALAAYAPGSSDPAPVEKAVATDLNDLIRSNSIYTAQRFGTVNLRPETRHLLVEAGSTEPGAGRPVWEVRQLNRLLLEDAFPGELVKKGSGIPWAQIGISALVTLTLLLGGITIFNKVEKTFMDTV
jgi:hypothetical protein